MSDTPPLTDAEIQALRDLVKASQFRKWVVTGVRGVSLWIVGVIAAWGAVKTFILEIFK
jgi:hypothetical protein